MTCWNLLETHDDLTYDTLLLLLLAEEYSTEEIERFRVHINACLTEVRETLAFREHVLEEYDAVGQSILVHKAEVMQALSARFARAEMKKVYSIIRRLRQEHGPGVAAGRGRREAPDCNQTYCENDGQVVRLLLEAIRKYDLAKE